MSKHTPEPWKTNDQYPKDVNSLDGKVLAMSPCDEDNGAVFRLTAPRFVLVNSDEAEANARRIVACVNACAGLPTEYLEKVKISGVMAGYEDRNAELLEALEKPMNTPSKCNRHGGYGFVSDCVVCQAIAKAKGEV